MKLGLYSSCARRWINKIRAQIIETGLKATRADMIKLRQLIIETNDINFQPLFSQGDFFSLSTFRDLFFHVQEHQFCVPAFQELLDAQKLKFLGFDIIKSNILDDFRKIHSGKNDAFNLSKWHEYETDNPDTFIGMYQFWVQKRL